MSKSVLIIDTPETCLDCMFCFELDEGIEACCSVMTDENDKTLCREINCKDGYCQNKPDWCPLSGGCDEGWNVLGARILGENNNV